jgi:hypothetical protein
MNGARLDPTFRDALRAELVARVASAPSRRRSGREGARRRSRRWLLRGGAAAVLVAAAGTAYALSSTSPGGTEITGQGPARTSEHTGTAILELGPRPAAATGVQIGFTCLSAGTVSFPNGSWAECDGADRERADGLPPMTDRYDLAPGQHTITVTADPDASWRITTRYISTRGTAWGVNAKGETYGVMNDQGEPDLQLVVATNGRTGYAYTRDLNNAGGPPPTDPAEAAQRNGAVAVGVPIPVYQSDGDTVVGQFIVGGG